MRLNPNGSNGECAFFVCLFISQRNAQKYEYSFSQQPKMPKFRLLPEPILLFVFVAIVCVYGVFLCYLFFRRISHSVWLHYTFSCIQCDSKPIEICLRAHAKWIQCMLRFWCNSVQQQTAAVATDFSSSQKSDAE